MGTSYFSIDKCTNGRWTCALSAVVPCRGSGVQAVLLYCLPLCGVLSLQPWQIFWVRRGRPQFLTCSTVDGKRLDSWINDLKWPQQDTPTPYQWLWKRFIHSSYLQYVPYWKNPPLVLVSVCDTVNEIPPTLFESIATCMKTSWTYFQRLNEDDCLLNYKKSQQATDIQISWQAFWSKAKLYMASDGRLDGGKGMHGWVLATKKHVLRWCSAPVDGFVSTQWSTRSELAGWCASSLLLVTTIARMNSRMWGIRHSSCSFVWVTDSKTAISRTQTYALANYWPTRMPDDVDMMALIASTTISASWMGKRPSRLTAVFPGTTRKGTSQ